MEEDRMNKKVVLWNKPLRSLWAAEVKSIFESSKRILSVINNSITESFYSRLKKTIHDIYILIQTNVCT